MHSAIAPPFVDKISREDILAHAYAQCRRALGQARGRTYSVGTESPVKVREALAAGCY